MYHLFSIGLILNSIVSYMALKLAAIVGSIRLFGQVISVNQMFLYPHVFTVIEEILVHVSRVQGFLANIMSSSVR